MISLIEVRVRANYQQERKKSFRAKLDPSKKQKKKQKKSQRAKQRLIEPELKGSLALFEIN